MNKPILKRPLPLRMTRWQRERKKLQLEKAAKGSEAQRLHRADERGTQTVCVHVSPEPSRSRTVLVRVFVEGPQARKI